ncbi:MAG: hypothetical protein WA862_10100, partial [Solirubrobacterales bacterium]
MVGLVMAGHGGSQALDSSGFELGGEIATRRPSVDQHCRSPSRLEQDRVPLTDVEHLDPQAEDGSSPGGIAPGRDKCRRQDGQRERREPEPEQPGVAPAPNRGQS